MGRHSETCGMKFILVQYVHTLQKISFNFYNFQTDVSVHKIGSLTQIYKKRQYLFFAWGMVVFLVSTTDFKGKGHTITRLCSHRGETISPTHSQPGARRRRFVSTMLQTALPSGKNCYSLYRRLRGRSWGHGKSSPSSGFDSCTVQPVSTELPQNN